MTTTDNAITKHSVIDIEDKDALKAGSAFLYEALGFGMMECRKALYSEKGNINNAAEHLASGAWMAHKLISWNHQGLNASTTELSTSMGLPETMCYNMLKNCAGNKELAQRKLMCLPALP